MKTTPWPALAAVLIFQIIPAASGLEVTGGGEHKRSITIEQAEGLFLPGAEEGVTLFPGHPELESRYSEASLVQMAYAALAEAIESSGHLVEFTLGDFRTYYRKDFERLLVRELITLDFPFRLEIKQTEVSAVDGAIVGRAFTPRWVERFTAEDLDEMREFMDHYRDFTVADGLELPEADETHQRMIAVTSYEVTVRFEGRSHTYRAAFKWIPGPPGEVTFVAEDHVTDGVDRALVVNGEVAPVKVLLGRSMEAPKGVEGERDEER
jgi:hypothetical protein